MTNNKIYNITKGMTNRKNTRAIKIGNKIIGNGNPILIQSMTNTQTQNVEETVKQIHELEEIGCEIIRVAVPNIESAEALKEIKKQINIPLVADIHFDYRLAILSMENGVDKIRINPGNIGKLENVEKVVKVAKEKNIPIRVGVNSGSLEKELIEKYNGVTPDGLVESAINNAKIIESFGYNNIVLSLKASNVPFALESYEKVAMLTDYPLHIGITEAGTLYKGNMKSAVGLGAILSRGIGDTIRVSLTASPLEEIESAKEILQSLGLRTFGVEYTSCPTCGRTEIDLISIAKEVEEKTKNLKKNIKIAVMGCVVNGPGEAREADYGIAGGKGVGIIFKKGILVKKVDESQLVDELIDYINNDCEY